MGKSMVHEKFEEVLFLIRNMLNMNRNSWSQIAEFDPCMLSSYHEYLMITRSKLLYDVSQYYVIYNVLQKQELDLKIVYFFHYKMLLSFTYDSRKLIFSKNPHITYLRKLVIAISEKFPREN